MRNYTLTIIYQNVSDGSMERDMVTVSGTARGLVRVIQGCLSMDHGWNIRVMMSSKTFVALGGYETPYECVIGVPSPCEGGRPQPFPVELSD